jgi:Rrf2 family protein
MLTARTRHALKLLAALARHPGDVPVGNAVLSAESGVPPGLINGIMVQLRNRDLVRSMAGRGGGHRLAKPPAEISMLDVVRAIDGPVAPLPCLSETRYQRCADCPDESACAVRHLLHGVNQAMLQTMAKRSLADAWPPGPAPAGAAGDVTPTSLIGVSTPLGKRAGAHYGPRAAPASLLALPTQRPDSKAPPPRRPAA